MDYTATWQAIDSVQLSWRTAARGAAIARQDVLQLR
jgi:hypothetical protein